MPSLVTIAYLTALIGFVCPPLWIGTIVCIVMLVRIGRARHAEVYRASELARIKAYAQFSR